MFPFDIFEQAFQGNWVAWFGIGTSIVGFALFCFLFILWLKLPQFAKAGFINNLIGKRPVVLECYENKKVRFQLPQILRSGLALAKGAWYVPTKLFSGSKEELSDAERQSLNAVYSGDGCPAGLYLNYSVQAQVTNPELVMIMQHEIEIQKLQNGEPVRIKRDLFFAAMGHVKDEYIQLSPMNLQFPLDIRALKTLLPKSLSKSELTEQENRIRDDVRKNMGGLGLGGLGVVLVLLSVISVIMGVILLLKTFGVF